MSTRLAPLAALSVVLAAAVGAYVISPDASSPDSRTQGDPLRPFENDQSSGEAANMSTFGSAAEFTEYVWTARMQTRGARYTGLGAAGSERVGGGAAVATAPSEAELEGRAVADAGEPAGAKDAGRPASAPATGGAGGAGLPDRYSGTNVQEEGFHEPDVVKTDGEHIYYAGRIREGPHRTTGEPDERDERQERGEREERQEREERAKGEEEYAGETRVIDATPPGTAELATNIEHSGRLFLSGDRLIVVGEKLWGYNVTNPAEPELVWTRNRRDTVETARLHNGTLYLVLASRVDPEDPCPIEPLAGATVACTEVYHPDRPVRVDVTYTAVTLDPATGEVRDELSFVGSRAATVYMSKGGLYATYTEETPSATVQLDFLLTDARPLLDESVLSRLETIRGYDLSPRSASVEVRRTLQRWFRSLPDDRRETAREKLRNRYEAYIETNRRNLTTTHIVRIDTNESTAGSTGGLSIAATGSVPGRPLNQFSLDEHEGHLRIATTVGERRDAESVNDVYVVDAANLSVTGSVTGMGETERIYAVRFVGDRGYVVTFRRVDPFHVLDLSDPSDPTMTGELKLPGYSSYLHPLPGDRVLGIGEEDGEVKAVIFDVSDPSDPTIEESRVLAADWSAVSRTHHAFLLDEKHGVFFLPTDHGGEVLSSTSLETVHTVRMNDPRRALYIDDYLYVFGNEEVAVVNETTWTRVDRLDL